ncbi:helix-turn-helix domain-containing protein (plasmid) [Deinococcus sp. KNUC1210]|uniref:winged helix-turn-helix domain-containing protein n=1 Tax=Deinococcus sp. KNUC1210 TaxID=2917691 RepID=UPI001EF09045|nr:helix-turn-helix domain-containing protein [Deinococcus sp. KNUC1210]ULH14048.1 helix-turn-helix domain-containing protein [Deinococcus sp. KNUC1210]
MTGPDSGSSPPHLVDNAALAALLVDPVSRRYYSPFLARTRSVGEAAQEVGCALDTLLYRVNTFLKAGLLEVVGERRRAGRAVRLYRTVHDAYFIPHPVTPFATLEERLYATTEPHLRAWARSTARRLQARGMEGIRLYRDTYGEVWSEGAADEQSVSGLDLVRLNDPARPPAFDVTTTLYLSAEEARAVQAALASLVMVWRERTLTGTNTSYSLSVFFSPEDT